jgi:hypothetical protein
MFEDCFGLTIGVWELMDIKAVVLNRFAVESRSVGFLAGPGLSLPASFS